MAHRTATGAYGAIMAGLADNALESAFSVEWIKLERGRDAVMLDLLDASEAEGLTVSEYRNRIGRGNLQAYADTLLAG